MKKNSPNTDSRQMSFLSDTARQTPEQSEIINISMDHGFPLQRCILPDGREMYAVQDWIAGVARPADTRVFWQQMKKRLQNSQNELYTACIQLPYLSSNGKSYQMDYADGQTLYGITQYMGVDTGIRNQVLAYLAKSGVFADKVREAIAKKKKEQESLSPKEQRLLEAKQSQGYSEDDAKTFLQLVKEGKVKRREWTAVLKLAIRGHINYGQVTNVEYISLFNMTAGQIKEITGFDIARDGMTPTGRAFLTAVELALEAAFNQYRDLSFQHALAITRDICQDCRISIASVEKRLGVSLATGQKLLR